MPVWQNKRQVPYHEKEILDCCVKAGYLVINRMLIAQAKPEQYILLSHDRNFEYMGEGCIQTNQAPCLIRSV